MTRLSQDVEANVRKATKEVDALERLKRAALWYALRGRVSPSDDARRLFLIAQDRLGSAALNYSNCVQPKNQRA